MSSKNRFSYIEVAIIAGILSFVGVKTYPHLATASTETKIRQLVDGLEEMRCKLDLYRAQHRDRFPPSDCFANFETAMTERVGKYGPYIKAIPTNSFNDLNSVRFDGEPAGASTAGWRFDTKTGLFQADHSCAFAAL